MQHTMKTRIKIFILILAALECAGIAYMYHSDSKQREIWQCIEQTEGTDTDCENCYFLTYGEYPK